MAATLDKATGRYRVTVQVRGRRIDRRLPRGATRQEAQRLFERLRARREAGDYQAVRLVPTSKALAQYLEYVSATQRQRTYQEKRRILGRWERDAAPRHTREVTRESIQAHLDFLIATGRGPATHNRTKAYLSAFCQWLIDRGLLASNPARAIRSLREQPQPPHFLSDADIRRLFAALDAPGNARAAHARPAIMLALLAGLRKQELLHLRWRHVSGPGISIQPDPETGWRPKSGRAIRTVPICPDLRAYLDRIRGDAAPSAPVVAYADRAVTHLNRAMRTLGAAIGAPRGFGLHTLRHTFACRALKSGVNIRTLQLLMGHDNITTTSRYLQHAGRDQTAGTALPSLP